MMSHLSLVWISVLIHTEIDIIKSVNHRCYLVGSTYRLAST
jgi:hypothetical protein